MGKSFSSLSISVPGHQYTIYCKADLYNGCNKWSECHANFITTRTLKTQEFFNLFLLRLPVARMEGTLSRFSHHLFEIKCLLTVLSLLGCFIKSDITIYKTRSTILKVKFKVKLQKWIGWRFMFLYYFCSQNTYHLRPIQPYPYTIRVDVLARCCWFFTV
jgi:hypothetical protein